VVAIRAGRLIDGTGAAVIDLSDATVMPGFIDMHTHITGDPSFDDFADVALKQAIEANIVPGPRMYVTAHSIGITGRHCDRNGLRPDALEEPGIEQGIANGVSQVREAVRYQMKYGADLT
jgi:imidazolonepropionase-like amidohydrolase